jgi:catechol 2,3-dioxygenase-like lactoylglutathione lyase family enzyme
MDRPSSCPAHGGGRAGAPHRSATLAVRAGAAGRGRGAGGGRYWPDAAAALPTGGPALTTAPDAAEAARERLRAEHLRPPAQRPASAARGLHHTALISSDVERTIRFYQDLLELPLTELIENRDYPGSSHFFFDIGNGNLLAFFDFPGLDLAPYAEVLGGLHHVAISVEPERWSVLVEKLRAAGVDHVVHSEVSVYFADPDGARIELIADPLGEMYGEVVR